MARRQIDDGSCEEEGSLGSLIDAAITIAKNGRIGKRMQGREPVSRARARNRYVEMNDSKPRSERASRKP